MEEKEEHGQLCLIDKSIKTGSRRSRVLEYCKRINIESITKLASAKWRRRRRGKSRSPSPGMDVERIQSRNSEGEEGKGGRGCAVLH